MFASRASTWPRDHFCRSTIAPRSSSPMTWNKFLPMSIPIVATVAVDLLDMAVLLGNPVQRHSLVGREHGRTIPLADECSVRMRQCTCAGDTRSDGVKSLYSN